MSRNITKKQDLKIVNEGNEFNDASVLTSSDMNSLVDNIHTVVENTEVLDQGVTTAQETANTAVANAAAAQNTANSASSAASTAQTAANTAQTTANSALSVANNSTTIVNGARGIGRGIVIAGTTNNTGNLQNIGTGTATSETVRNQILESGNAANNPRWRDKTGANSLRNDIGLGTDSGPVTSVTIGAAPTSHATSANTHGLGCINNYGHLGLPTSTSNRIGEVMAWYNSLPSANLNEVRNPGYYRISVATTNSPVTTGTTSNTAVLQVMPATNARLTQIFYHNNGRTWRRVLQNTTWSAWSTGLFLTSCTVSVVPSGGSNGTISFMFYSNAHVPQPQAPVTPAIIANTVVTALGVGTIMLPCSGVVRNGRVATGAIFSNSFQVTHNGTGGGGPTTDTINSCTLFNWQSIQIG
ncbi:MAG: pyocin knob domain-containing protein [Firmicutes bacterium]|nr:pyocin knob domain-containing protein [Bacillota bacterium]